MTHPAPARRRAPLAVGVAGVLADVGITFAFASAMSSAIRAS